MQTEKKYLQIEGVVGKKILTQLIDEKKYSKPNTLWLFVGYSPVEYKLNTKFDIILSNEERMLPKLFNIKLLEIIEQTGKPLKAIPAGWKTICRFEFKMATPKIVRELPVLSAWSFKSKLKFARHEDVNEDWFNPVKRMYTEVIKDFISMSIHSNSIDKKNKMTFLETCSKILHDNELGMKNKISNPNLIEEVKRQELHLVE